MSTSNSKVITIFKYISTIITAIMNAISVVWTYLDIDMEQKHKDNILLWLQISAGGLLVLWFIFWVGIPWLRKVCKILKFKYKYGVDITKIDNFYEKNKDKTLKAIVEEIEARAKSQKLKDIISEIKKEGVIDTKPELPKKS